MKKILQLAAPALLLLAMVLVYHLSADSRMAFNDVAGHEALEDILYWTGRGALSGSDGAFRPEGSVTKAELATVLTRLLPLEETAENAFADVPADSWYAPALLRCVAAGVFAPEGDALQPLAPLSREQGFTALARAFAIAPAAEERLLEGYNDAKLLAPENRLTVEALLEQQLITGGNDVQLYPRQPFTRAELTMALSALQAAGYVE